MLERRLGFGLGLLLGLVSVLVGGCGDDASPMEDSGPGSDTGPGGDGGTEEDGGGGPDAPPCLCTGDADCDDGVFCNGDETCAACACVPGDARTCDDGVECTIDSCDEDTAACVSVSPDFDGDGHRDGACAGGDDCDDAEARRFPGATEICDDEGLDEDCDPDTFGSRDIDGDGYVDARCCNTLAPGMRVCASDCDDARRSVNPGESEVCEGLDNDCDGDVDDGVDVPGFVDADGDLHGDPGMPRMACAGTTRFSVVGDDCDDRNRSVHGSQPEICDLIDNDCDGEIDEGAAPVTWYADTDGDGFGDADSGTVVSCVPVAGHALVATDCDDGDALRNPAAAERCNGLDDDCNGSADFSIGTNDTEDDDGDGFTDASCEGGDDCDDDSWDVHPGAPEICDFADNDCDGTADLGTTSVLWYLDADGDLYGDPETPPIDACEPQPGRLTRAGDCDDADPAVRPGRPDGCNGVDDDCDGDIDEGSSRLAFYTDADGDGVGASTPVLACTMPPGAVQSPGDCDDADDTVYPAAPETCDADDDDCDGTVDEGADTLCMLPHATSSCSSGTCALGTCDTGFRDCDATASTGCEIDVRSDDAHCGTCGRACTFGPNSSNDCVDSMCNFSCSSGFADCDAMQGTGCEVDITSNPLNCGMCGTRCSPRPNADPACVMMGCTYMCRGTFRDCNGMVADGCEIDVQRDNANCGVCGRACTDGDVCVRGSCQANLLPSTGADGVFAPAVDTVLPAGVYNYTTINIPAGVTVTTDGTGVLDLRATGDITIAGTLNVSGARGGSYSSGVCAGAGRGGAGGGATGNVLGLGNVGTSLVCGTPGTGGEGAAGSNAAVGCGLGGNRGGGMGGSSAHPGAGGGGFAGGGGGGGSSAGGGGAGASISGESMGGAGAAAADAGGQGGEPSAGVYAGGNGGTSSCGNNGGGGGGGSIGMPAALDAAVATTFRPGSGGGGGGGGSCEGGNGGGGGGGGVRLATPGRINITATGSVRATGGAGVIGNNRGASGGGSGGVIYLAAPDLRVDGTINAAGGLGGIANMASCGNFGGNGGPGRIRISTVPERCTLFGNWNPMLVSGCDPTAMAPMAGRVYIDVYPF